MAGSDPIPGLSRRHVLRLGSLVAGSAAFSVACRSGSSSPPLGGSTGAASPLPATVPSGSAAGVSRVVLIRTDDRVAGTQTAIDHLQPQGLKGRSVFLKPNFNTADPAPAATDADLLEALVRELHNAGARAITVADRSGMADTRRAMETKGVFRMADRQGLRAMVLDELEREDWQLVAAEGTHWPRGFAVAKPALEAGAVVSTCCLKTHRFGGHFTLSLKNSVGLVAKRVPGDPHDYMRDLHSSPHQRRMIAEINQTFVPALVLIDAVEAFVRGGPESGEKVKAGVILAGTDRVALDVVGIALLRSLGTTAAVAEGSIWELEQIRRAVELGLGAGGPDQIEIVTADAAGASMADELRTIIDA